MSCPIILGALHTHESSGDRLAEQAPSLDDAKRWLTACFLTTCSRQRPMKAENTTDITPRHARFSDVDASILPMSQGILSGKTRELARILEFRKRGSLLAQDNLVNSRAVSFPEGPRFILRGLAKC